jgi:N4-gp56 family major capsid protein
MAVNTTSVLTNSLRAEYLAEYLGAVYARRVYDQFAFPISQDKDVLQRSSSVNVPFISSMTLNEAAISETVDITPQTLVDGTASITPTSRGDAIQDSELLLLQNYTDYAAERFKIVGEAMQDSVEVLACAAALQGSLVLRAAARASLDAGTAGHRLAYADLAQAEIQMQALRCPMFEGGGFAALMGGEPYYDLITTTPILGIGQYQDQSIFLNGEIGKVGNLRILVSPFAKVFGGAGADNGTGAAATTLAAKASPLAKTITVASATSVQYGQFVTIGTEETGSTFYSMNERVKYVSEASTVITIVGQGSNGGLKYEHASGAGVRNADSVHPIIVGGPKSIAKVFASDVGEYGQVIGPKPSGLLDQFVSLGWKWYGAYGRIAENWLHRLEVSSSLDA